MTRRKQTRRKAQSPGLEYVSAFHFTDRRSLALIEKDGAIKPSLAELLAEAEDNPEFLAALAEELHTSTATGFEALEKVRSANPQLPGSPMAVYLTSDPDPSPYSTLKCEVRIQVRLPREHALSPEEWAAKWGERWPKHAELILQRAAEESRGDWFLVERAIPRSEWVSIEEFPITIPSEIAGALSTPIVDERATTSSEILPGLFVGGVMAEVAGFSALIDLVAYPGLTRPIAPGTLYLAHPIEDEGAIRDPHALRAVGDLIVGLVEAGHRVLVRCHLGLNRAPLVAACALIRGGADPEEAIDHLRSTRSPRALSNEVFEAWLRHDAGELLPPGDCPLCRAEYLTRRFHEDDECWIADCLVCGTPMIVWREHSLPDAGTEHRLLQRLDATASDEYGGAGYVIDRERRQIPDHWHAHARPVQKPIAGSLQSR